MLITNGNEYSFFILKRFHVNYNFNPLRYVQLFPHKSVTHGFTKKIGIIYIKTQNYVQK